MAQSTYHTLHVRPVIKQAQGGRPWCRQVAGRTRQGLVRPLRTCAGVGAGNRQGALIDHKVEANQAQCVHKPYLRCTLGIRLSITDALSLGTSTEQKAWHSAAGHSCLLNAKPLHSVDCQLSVCQRYVNQARFNANASVA